MADIFRLLGSYGTEPVLGSPSGQPSIQTPIDETTQLSAKSVQQYDLVNDAPQAVALAGLAGINALMVKTIGGKVVVRITSTDGSLQSIPVEGFLALLSLTTPITAIDLTRTPGTETLVTLFIGQRG